MRTSDIYWVPGPWPGRLGVVPRPRGGDWLADEVHLWRTSGLDVVTSLLTPDEAAELELQDEAFRRIEKARGRPVPDTAEQREWVAGMAPAGVHFPPA